MISTERFETAWRASVANGVAPARWSVVSVSLRSQKVCEAAVEVSVRFEVLEESLGPVKGEDVAALR
jgi:hypothetical protein